MLDEKDLDSIRKIVVPIEEKVDSMEKKMDSMEEKMDSMEEKMDSMEEKMDSVEKKMDSVEEKMNSMEEKVSSMENEVGSLKNEVSSIQLTLENETNRNIVLIAEGHLDLSRKLDEALRVETEKEMLLIRVNQLENELRRVKDRLDEIA